MGQERPNESPFRKAPQAHFGRYEVLEPIAGGGMGVVYAARDPDLDRRVAIKVVHPRRKGDARSQSRLLREARALARLDHPNVVKVHDVLSHDDEIFVVMELVSGETLASWEAAAPRNCDEVLKAYIQAGKGLVAAHALDIVHRDFKPSNAIIGADGRVRVLDFGLARLESGDVDPDDAQGASGAITKTVPGAVFGTLVYAAPEQLSSGEVTAASDQFSFCVALHRALEGTPPFAGTSVSELVTNIRASAPVIATDGRRVPTWLRATMFRGLAFDPGARHPSMASLLAELERPRGWRRWRLPATMVSVGAIATVATLLLQGRAAAPASCDGGARDAALVWSPVTRAVVGNAISRVGTAYASNAADTVIMGLDGHIRDWRAVHREACLEHQHAATSDALFDREMACLHRRLDDMSSAIGVLQGTTAASVDQAADVVAGIPTSAECTDLTRLLADTPPPVSPAIATQVALVREQLGTIAALRRAGRVEEAAPEIETALVGAKATAYSPVIAEAELEHGRLAIQRGDFDDTTAEILLEAMQVALASHQPALAIEAAARRIYIRADSLSVNDVQHELDYLIGISGSIPNDHFARPLLLNNVGVVYKRVGRLVEASEYFEQAHDIIAADPAPDLELVAIDQNRAMLTHDAGRRESLLRAVRDRLSGAVGEQHLATLKAGTMLALFTGDAKRALAELLPLCTEIRREHPALVDLVARCESWTGILATELGDVARANVAYETLVDATRGSTNVDVVASRQLAIAALAVQRGDKKTAIEHFKAVIADRAQSKEQWRRYDAAFAQLGLGVLTRDLTLLDAAISTFEAVARSYEWITCKVALAHARQARDSIAHR